MKNAELIKALRDARKHMWTQPQIELYPMMEAAADAFEAAEKRIDGLQKLVDINTERCEALRKQLREAHKSYEKHINELEAQLPKEGEWEERYIDDANPMFRRRFYCSRCGEWTTYGKTRYCPFCGAKMTKGEHYDHQRM